MSEKNIYNSASARMLNKFNSDKPNFCESAHWVTPEECQQALENLNNLISKTKKELANEN